ncbi:MAG: aminotransferase class V-fold PLP-dependent enzyme [Candidatus Aminicenantales bacterium]
MLKSRTPDPLETIHARVRARFPLLDHDAQGRPRIYLNSGAGSLMVDSAMEAAAEANRTLNPMPGAVCRTEIDTARLHDRVRGIAADFLHARSSREISFHHSTTAALFNLAFALRDFTAPGDNLVVTDLDHMANVSPWEIVIGTELGREIRRAAVSNEGTLDVDHLLSLVDRRTRVLAMTMASNGFGSVPPLAEIIAAVRPKAPGCLVVIDAVHHALHGPIDVRAIDCDALAFSGYKVFGPMLGVLWGKESVLEMARPYRVETNKNEPPYKFEQGMLNNASLASLEAAIEYILWLGEEAAGPERAFAGRREKFAYAMTVIADYEKRISRRVLEEFRKLDPGRFTYFGLKDPDRCGERDPTFAFEISGESASDTKKRLWERHGIQIADGNHYSAAVFRHLKKPALCRASFAHYDTMETVEQFLAALEDIAGGKP